ncbi:MAG: hypothetical protein ACK5JD_13720 [Mangrovibacterium sp.]
MKGKILIIMLLFLNMTARVTLGNVQLNNISSFEVQESILDMSNTAKITIPRNYAALDGKFILEQFKVGDPMAIYAGYDGELALEFKGYIREIESDYPLVIHCDDETYPLRQNDLVKSYPAATLRQVLTDIIPDGLSFNCPDVSLGRFQIDHESSFQVLQRIKEDYGLYSRLQNGVLSVNLRDLTNSSGLTVHSYVLNPGDKIMNLVKKNELKYKRKEDYKLHVKVTALKPDGKKQTVEVGSKTKDASLIQVTYPGTYSEAELLAYATSIYNKRCYDGYNGTITGFGTPRTHAGDALEISDKDEEQRSGRYLIEKVVISYDEGSGFSRENSLSYKLE